MKKKTIFILIESVKRELNSKTLLALRLLKKNYRVVIGQKGNVWSIFNKCNPGIVLLKSFGPKNTETIDFLKKKKFKIVSNDEEIIVAWNMNDRVDARMNNENLIKIDGLLSVGELDSKEIKKQFPLSANKVSIVGNIRLELLKKKMRTTIEEESKLIKDKYGDFILFTTQFGRVNITNQNKSSIDYVFSRIVEDNIDPVSTHISNVNDQIIMQREILLQTLKFLNNFEKNFPTKKLIISPHPVENKLFWERLLEKKNFKNILINKDKFISISSFIDASDLVISSNSTTLLESFFLEKKLINFLGKKDRIIEIDFLKKISNVVRSADELNYLLKDQKNIKKYPETVIMSKIIKNFDKDFDAFDGVIDVFDKLNDVENYKEIFINSRLNFKMFVLNGYREIKNTIKKLIKYKGNDDIYNRLHNEKIGRQLTYTSFYKRIMNMNKIEKVQNIKIRQIIPEVFLLDLSEK